MKNSIAVSSTIALWFRIARVFGMASVSIGSAEDGNLVRTCIYRALQGYVFGAIFNLSYIGYVYNVFLYGTMSLGDRWMWFWAVDFAVTLVVVNAVVIGGTKAQGAMIQDLMQLEKINIQVNSCYADRVKKRSMNTYVIFLLIFLYLLMDVKISYDVYYLPHIYFAFFCGIVQFEYLLMLGIKVRLMILTVEIHNTLQIINEELQRLYDMIDKDFEPKSEVFVWSLSRRLRVLCHSYCATIQIYKQANKSNELKSIIIFFLYAYRLTSNVYLMLIRILTADRGTVDFVFLIIFLIVICVTQLVEMIQFTGHYQHIYDEVESTFVILRRFRNRADSFGKRVVKHLDIFIDFALEKAFCTPLGVFTIESSLVATTITAMATCLAIVFQFQSIS